MRKVLAVLLSLLVSATCYGDAPQRGLDIVDVSFMSLTPAAVRLLEARERGDKEIVLNFDSPGGDIRAMFAFAALMRHVELGGTKVTCVVHGMAASAGLYLLEMCDERIGVEGSIYLAHEVSVAEAGGKPADLEKTAKTMRDLTHMMMVQMAARMKITVEELERRTHDTDYWFDYREALQIGAIDRVMTRTEAMKYGIMAPKEEYPPAL